MGFREDGPPKICARTTLMAEISADGPRAIPTCRHISGGDHCEPVRYENEYGRLDIPLGTILKIDGRLHHQERNLRGNMASTLLLRVTAEGDTRGRPHV